MIKIPFEQILEKITTQANLPKEEIQAKIDQKMELLNGLISKEGAAHIVANELGVKLLQAASGMMKINQILPGMRSIETVGRAVAVYEVREFKKENNEGKVGSCIIADDTGSIRVTCWHAQADYIAQLKVDDIVRVADAYVRDNNGSKELHLNDKSRFIINPPNITVEVAKQTTERKRINELAEYQSNVELFGTIVQVFEPKFYETCSQCRKRARAGEDGYKCDTHGIVTPNYSYVMNVILDDGTDNVRIVCFSDQANQLANKTEEEFLSYKNNIQLFEDVKNDLLGMQIIINGKVQKNAMFDRIEFMAQNINRTPDVDEEIKKLDEELAAVIQ